MAATTPTFSWPWMSGYGVERAFSVPAYCSVSPRNVCLSVPQIPDAIMRSSTAPGASTDVIGASLASPHVSVAPVARELAVEVQRDGPGEDVDGAVLVRGADDA